MIERVPYSWFAPEVIAAVGDVPEDMADNYIRMTANNFCRRTNILQRCECIRVWEGVSDYLLDPHPSEDIVRIRAISDAKSDSDCSQRVYDTETYRFSVPNFLHFTRYCGSEDGGVNIQYVVTPAINSCEVDKLLYDRHSEAIINGAIARLLLQPASPWANPGASSIYAGVYEEAIKQSGINRIMGHKFGPVKIKGKKIV